MKKNHTRKSHTIKPLVYGIRTAILTAGMAVASSGVVLAGPTGGVIAAGSGQITNPNAQSTVINQNSQRLVANWQTFNIGASESVTFRQPNASAIALNRIFDQNPSQIFGSLNANGRVFFVNPNGMYFGKSARVNVGSLVATTLKIDSKKFMSGMNVLGDLTIPAGGAIVNQGLMQAATGGSISLIAGEVRNEGIIVANLGHVNLASGRKAILDFDGDGLIHFEIQGNIEQNLSQAESAVVNSGEITANGGQVLLTAAAAKDVFTNVVNNEGVIRANSIQTRNGEIFLVGADAGIVRNSGMLDVSGKSAGETGGSIKVLGKKVDIFDGSELNASGNAGGGEILLGGNYQGHGDERIATVTHIGKNTNINADAIENGDGGKVIVWADDTTRFYGDISARGGSQSGNGGFAEVSGKNVLTFDGLVDTTSVNGNVGVLLLDPTNFDIVTTTGDGSGDADIEVATLVTNLDTTDIVLSATNTINVLVAVDASGNASHSLELNSPTINLSDGADITLNDANITLAGNVILLDGATVSLDTGNTGNTGTITFNGSINGTAGGADESLTLISGNALAIPTLNLTGNLTATATTGNLTDSGTVTVGGNANFTTSAANADIDLGTLDVAGTIAVNTSRDVTLTNANGLDFQVSTVGGNLTATATTGDITDLGIITVGGNAAFTTIENNKLIILELLNVANTKTIAVNTAGVNGHVTMVNENGIDFQTSVVNGDLNARAIAGDIGNSGAITVKKSSVFTAADGVNVILDNTGNDFTGAVTISSLGLVNNLAFADNLGVNLRNNAGAGRLFIRGNNGALNGRVNGNLTITSKTGNITDSNTITVGGNAAFTTTAANADIDLGTLDVTGTISANTNGTTGHATLVNAGALDLAASTVGGNLTATASTGNLTDSGLVSVGGNAAFTTTVANADIDLGTLDVTGTISANTNGTTGHATLVNAGALDLSASTVGGNLTATASTGNLSDSGLVSVAGNAVFTTTTANADIDLGTLDVTGTLSANTNGTTGHATLVNGSALALAASTVGGNLTATASTGNLTDSGLVSVGGNATFTTTAANADIDLGTLDVTGTLSANTNGTTGHATLVNAGVLDLAASTVGGNLTATASTGNLTDSGLVSVAGNAVFTTTAANADIDLGTLDVAGTITANTNGTTDDVTLVNATALDLQAMSIGGNLIATANTGNLTDSGLVSVGGNATFTTTAANADIDLGTLDVTGTISANTNGTTGHATLVNAGALDLAASTVGGNLTATASTGNLTDSGLVSVGGNAVFTTTAANADIDLGTLDVAGTITANTNGTTDDVTLVNATALDLQAMSIGGNLIATANTGNLTDSGLVSVGGNATFTTTAANANIDLGTLDVTGTISANTNGATGHATLVNAGALDLAASTVGGNLTATASTGNLTDSGLVSVGGNAAFTTTVANADIDLGTLDVTGTISANTNGTTGHATLVNAGALDLSASTVGGNLTATASTGNLSDSGLVSVGGNAAFTTTTANADIDLGTLDVTGTLSANTNGTTGHATLVNASALDLSTSTVGGNLTTTASTGNLTDSGLVSVGGNAAFTTTAANADIDLGTLDVTGTLSANTNGTTGHATLVNAGVLDLAASTVGGNLTATASTGNLTDSGLVSVAGNAVFTTTAANADIDLGTLDVAGTITANTNGTTDDVTLVNATALDLQAMSIGGNLIATANTGNLTDSGLVSVGGNATFTTTAANADIDLGTLDVTGTISANTNGTTGHATLVNAGALDLAASTVGGNLTATASTGNLTDSGLVSVGGNAVFTTTAANADIDLGTLDVAGTITANTNGTTDDVTLVNATALDLQAMSIGGNLIATANTGNLTDSGLVSVGGNATFTTTAANANIDLGTLDVTGTISANTNGATGHATLVNAGALDLAASTVGGNLTATASTGNLTDSGLVSVGGNAAFTTTVANADIDLGTLDVTGTISANTNGTTGHATLVNAGALDLSASTVGGNLTATASTGNLSDSGLVSVGGNAAFTTTTANADIDLGTLDVTGTLSANTNGTTGHATLVNASALDLSTSTVGGNLTTTASTGNLTDSGLVSVGGNAAFTTTAANADIDLGTLDVTGTLSANTNGTTGHATLVNAGVLDLAASTVGGNLTATASTGNLTDSGLVSVAGNAVFTTTAANADIDLGTLDVAGTITANTNGTTDDVTLVNATALDLQAMSIGGNLIATANTGNLTDSGLVSVGGNATFTTTAANADIDLGTLDVTGTISANTNGTTGHATLVNAGALDLAASTVGGNLTATASTGNLTDSGLVSVGGNAVFTTTAANADIDLGTLDVAGTITANTNGTTGHATLVNAGALDLAASTVGGNLTTTASTGNLTDSGLVSVGGNAAFTTTTANADIDLGTLDVTGTLSANTNGTTGHATLVNGSALALAASTVGGNLTTTASTGNLTDSGLVSVGGNAAFTTTAANADIDLGTLDVTGTISANTNGTTGHATLVNGSALDLSASTVGGNLTATASTGNLTDSGLVSVGGNAVFTTTAANADIDLGTLDVAGTITANTNGTTDDVTLVNATTLDLQVMSIGGNLIATANTGNLTDSGLVSVGGNATFTTTAANANIDLGTLDVTGTISANTNGATGHATLANAGALDLAASTVGGNLTTTASTGNLTDSGLVSVGGNAAFTTTAANADIDLGTLDVTGTISANTNGTTGHATLVNAGALDLSASTVGGNLTTTASTGNLTDNGLVSVGGNATFTTTAANADIDLGTLDVTGTLSANTNGTTGHATLVNASALDLSTSTVGGNLTTTTNTGNLTDSGLVTVGGNAAFTTTAANATIDLGTLAVTGTTAVNTNGATGHATLVNANALDLAASTVGGNLTTTASTGNLTDSGLVTVGDNAAFTTTAANADIDLGTLAITGTTAVNTNGSTGHATLVNANALDLAASTVGGNLTTTASTGNLTDSGLVTVGGNAAFTTTAANATIDLGTLAVTGTTAVNTNGATGHAMLVNANALDLAASTVGGNLTTTASTGNLTDSGLVTVGGNAAFTTTAANAIIDMDTLAISGTTAVNTNGSAGHARLVNTSALNLAASTVGGNLTAISSTGNISDSGDISVGGLATFIANSGANMITLGDTSTANFGSLNVTGSTVTIKEGSSTNLAGMNADALTIISSGDISDTGNINVSGLGTFNANSGTNAITLGDGTIANFGSLNLAGGNVVVTENSDMVLAGVNATSLNLTANGTITDSTSINVINLAVFNAGSNDIVLGDGAGDVTNFGSLSLIGKDVTITEDSSTQLAGIQVNSLNLTSAGAITDAPNTTINVTNRATLNAGANSITLGDILLGDVTNFGSLSLTGGTVTISEDSSSALAGVQVNSLNLTSAGAITDVVNTSTNVTNSAKFISGSSIVFGDNAGDVVNFGSISVEGGDISITENSNMLVDKITSTGIVTLNVGGGVIEVVDEATRQQAKEFHFTASRVGTSGKAFKPVVTASFSSEQSIIFANSGVLTLIGTEYVRDSSSTATFIQAEVLRSNGVERGRLIGTEAEGAVDAALFDESITMFSILDPGLLLPSDQLEDDECDDEDDECDPGEVAQSWNIEQKLQQNEGGAWEMESASEMFDFSDEMEDVLTVSSYQ